MRLKEIHRAGGFASVAIQRSLDVLFFLMLRVKIPEKIALVLLAPFSICGYYLSLGLDKIDSRDALGWAVFARKQTTL